MANVVSFQKVLISSALAGLTAGAINVALFFLAQATGLISEDLVIGPGQTISPLPIIISSIIPSLIAGLLCFLLVKYTKNGFRTFQIIALVLMVLSFMNPFLGISNITVPSGIVLDIMHAVVVFSLLYFLRRSV